MAVLVPFFRSNMGPKYLGLYCILLSQKRFDRQISYLYYRVRLTSHGRSHTDTFRHGKTLQNLELICKDRKFSGEDWIIIFYFLIRHVEEWYTLDISE